MLANRHFCSELEASFDFLTFARYVLYVFILTAISSSICSRIFAVVLCFSLRASCLLIAVNFGRCADRLLQFIALLFSDLGITLSSPIVLVVGSFPGLFLSLRFLY